MAEKSIKNHDILTTYINKLWKICLINTLKVPNKHPYKLIYSQFHTASYTIIRSILSGTYTNVPTYTLVRAYTDTDFFFFFFYICHSIPLFVTPLLFGTLEECETICATKCPNKIKPECHMLNKKNFSLQLDYKVNKTKTKLDSISICIEKKSLHYLYCNWTHSLDMTSWPMKFKLNFVNPHLRLL